MRKVLITGGAGFIGSHLVEVLCELAPETDITVLDDFSTGFRANVSSPRVEVVEGTVLDQEVLNKALRGSDSVVHLAALGSVPRSVQNPVASFETNANGTLNVLEASRNANCKRLIFASSSSVYGTNEELPKHEYQWVSPKSPYAASKLAAEALVSSYRTTFGMNNSSFRFFNVYGPRQDPLNPYAAVIPRLISAVKAGERFQIYGDGTQSRDFTYVRDVANVLASQILEPRKDLPLANLAFGGSTSLLELVSISNELLGREVLVDFQPRRVGDVKASQNLPDLILKTMSDFDPTPFRQGLALTFKSHGLL